MKIRSIALILLMAAGVSLLLLLYSARVQTPLEQTLAPAFQILGTPVRMLDKLVARVVPVDELDERQLGEVYRAHFDAGTNKNDPDYMYLNDLMAYVSRSAKKNFLYRVYLLESKGPNAAALPGGIVLVTRGLLNTLGSESEVAAVLAHEVGHIERGHCFEAVKFQLLSRKIGNEPLGRLADLSARILARHAFSKIEEDDADQYAYDLICFSGYDPRAVGQSFGSMLRYSKGTARNADTANPIRDYFMSHPPLELREAKFRALAEAWWKLHPGARAYVGSQNLRQRKTYGGGLVLQTEWTTGPQKPSVSRLPPPSVLLERTRERGYFNSSLKTPSGGGFANEE